MQNDIATIQAKEQRVMRLFTTATILSLMMVSMAFAANTTGTTGQTASTIETGVTTGLAQIYNLMTAILAPAAVVVFAWSAFKALFLGEKGLESAKKSILMTICLVGVVWLAPAIIVEVSGWFSGIGQNSGVFSAANTGGTP